MNANNLSAYTVIFSAALFSSHCASTEHAPKSIDETDGTIDVQLIRSATVAIRYKHIGRKDIKILVDPILADEHTEPPIDYSNGIKNPTIKLPIDKNQLIQDLDAVLLTHYHPDHFDLEAEKILPKGTLIFCQPYDEGRLREKGFSNLRVVTDAVQWEGLTISRFLATHYKGATGAPPFGESSSFFVQSKRDNVFFTGDAILDEKLQNSLLAARPKTIVANTGECQFTKENPVLAPGVTMTLTAAELKEMARTFPESRIVAVHMDGINHCSLTKQALRRFVDTEKLNDHILVPNEGETIAARTAAPAPR